MSTISNKLHFPARLYQMIEIEDPSIIAWEISGKSFRIVDSKRFRAETIPKYFRHGNMASIQRQLNLYGFRCTNRIDEKGVFFHPNFIRGQYDLVRDIRRKKTWPTKRKPKADEESSFVPTPAPSPAPARQVYSGTRSQMQQTATVPPVPVSAPASGSDPVFGTMNEEVINGFYPTTTNNELGCLLPECGSPLSNMLSDEYLMDFFDDKTIDDMIMINNALDSDDFDQNLLSLFVQDDFPVDFN